MLLKVSDFLPTGKKNPITGRKLCELLHVNSRQLQTTIERERRAGIPICANMGNNPGYFLAATADEMKQYCRSLYTRAGSIFKTRRACLKTIDKLPAEKE